MNVDVITSVEINRPIDVVANFAADPDHAPLWYKNIKYVVWPETKKLVQGGKVDFVAHFLGRRLAYTYEIVSYEAEKKLVMRTAQGPFPMETTYTWQALSNHATSMTLRNCGSPQGFNVLIAPFMQWVMRKANKQDLKALKALLEKKS